MSEFFLVKFIGYNDLFNIILRIIENMKYIYYYDGKVVVEIFF